MNIYDMVNIITLLSSFAFVYILNRMVDLEKSNKELVEKHNHLKREFKMLQTAALRELKKKENK